MSKLKDGKRFPAQYTENGHGTALRQGLAFAFKATIPALAAGASSIVRFVTGDRAIFFASGSVTINQEDVMLEVYEDVTFTNDGSLNTSFAINLNRVNPTSTQIQFYTGAVVSNIGTQVLQQSIKGVAGQNVNNPGFGTGGQDDASILKPNTEHIFKVTNNSVLAVDIDAVFKYNEADPTQYR